MSNPMIEAMGRKQLDYGKTPWGAASELRAALEAAPCTCRMELPYLHAGSLDCLSRAAQVLLDWMGADDED